MGYSPELKAAVEAEVHDKVHERMMNAEEASFYRHFLAKLSDKIRSELKRGPGNVTNFESNLDTTDKTISEIFSAGTASGQNPIDVMSSLVTQAQKEANAKVDESDPFIPKVEPKALLDMTPKAFFEYIEKLQSTLIKKG